MVTHRAVLAVSGEGMFVLDGHPLPFRSGTLLFVFQGERFHIESEGELTYLYIGFEGGRAEELLRRFDLRRTNRYFDGFDGLIPLWCESLSRASEQTVDLAAESVLLYTFSRLAGTVKERSEVVERMLALTEERFTDPDLSLSSLAEELSYNAKYLSHLFKEKLGTSYSDYLRTLRIKYAVSLFDHGIESVKNVALLSGFSDPLYFSTIFKRHTGRSPSDYRAGLDAHDGENGT
jgi:two-component system response regulator YesN